MMSLFKKKCNHLLFQGLSSPILLSFKKKSSKHSLNVIKRLLGASFKWNGEKTGNDVICDDVICDDVMNDLLFVKKCWQLHTSYVIKTISYSGKLRGKKDGRNSKANHDASFCRLCRIMERTTWLFMPRMFSTKVFFHEKKISTIFGFFCCWRRKR